VYKSVLISTLYSSDDGILNDNLFSFDLGHHKFLMQHVSEAGSASVFRKIRTPNLADLFDTAQSLTVTLKADSHIACRAHAVPMPCRAAEGLECVFPI
jgi:hypothetical protein